MSGVLLAVAVFAALVGHAALWIGLVNRFHAINVRRSLIVFVTALGYAMLLFGPGLYYVYLRISGGSGFDWSVFVTPNATWYYLLICWGLAVGVTALWVPRHLFGKTPRQVLSHETKLVDVAERLGWKPLSGFEARLLSLVPANQVLQIAVEEMELEIARLPAALDGFSIVQITDWHITGKIGIEFFHEVVRQANALDGDMVALCGDLIEDAEHLSWIPETFGRLRAKHGVYFILGNHDVYTRDVPGLRQRLLAAGLIGLGGCRKELEIGGAEVVLAGSELPWFAPPADMSQCPARSSGSEQLRILLSHSPDQFRWAQQWDFDLMLAGHTHGGQIRLPIVGPIVAPSLHGVKYASGTFFVEPTLMHVSRGISAEEPIRLNCPPELTKLVLRCGRA
jgi:uncharacterized protein